MELGRHRIRLLIILPALVFSVAVSLSGCGGGGNGGGGGGNNPPPTSSACNQNPATKVYNCNINITITAQAPNGPSYSQSGGVSVTVANPQ
jgi:hypothetical protein